MSKNSAKGLVGMGDRHRAHCQMNQFQAYRVTLKGQFQKQTHANQL